jgi:hypothetical protein
MCRNRVKPWAACAAVMTCALVARCATVRAEGVAEERAAIDSKCAADLEQLAAWCEQHHLIAEARETREWHIDRDPHKLYVFALPDSLVVPARLSESADRAEWWDRFTKLRRGQADSLYELAGKALAAHRLALAYELIRESAREWPDHERARAVLGFEKYDGRWVTPYAAKRLASGQVFDDRFGWVPAADVSRYEHGERNYRGTWLSAEKDASLHAPIKNGWRIETEHFVVTTNHSLEAGVRLATKLERLNDIWRSIFVTYYMYEGELAKRYRGDPLPRHETKHQVVLFRTRDEYNTTLRPAQPMIDVTLGYYWFETHTAYFFVDAAADDSALWHEATHQLFQESRSSVRDLGSKNNFWIVEAVAIYMESLVDHHGYYTLGGPDDGRVPAALTRLLKDNFYMPLAEVAAFGRDTLQHQPRLATLYTQFGGLANFFMHYGGGRYRQPFIDGLVAVYSGRAEPGTLAKLTGAGYDKLDEQYRDYMKELIGKAQPPTK